MELKKIMGALICMCMYMGMCISASACTGFYVGKRVSSDGTAIIARTEDMTSSESKRFIIHPTSEYKAGDEYTDAFGLKIKYSHDSYRYSAIPGSKYRGIGKNPYGAAGFNENGVGATATITAYPNDKVIASDPYVESGLHELSMADIILSQASTAREGVEIMAEIADEQGNGEGSTVMVFDKDETWYMELYTGHQYAAVKLPYDMAAVMANNFMLGETDINSKDVIVSEDIISVATESGTFSGTGNVINLRKSYGETLKESNAIRLWGGHRMLHGNTSDKPLSDYALLYKPTAKITLQEVMEASRYRYEDTKYSADLPQNDGIRVIGTSRQEECHILQIDSNLAKEGGCVEWLCMGNAEFAPYIPYFSAAMTDTPEMCRFDSEGYSPYSMYWSQRSLSTIAATNRQAYGNAVREFYKQYETNMVKNIRLYMNSLDGTIISAETANSLAELYTYDVFNKNNIIYRELIKFMADFEGKKELGESVNFQPSISYEVDKSFVKQTSLPTVITIE